MAYEPKKVRDVGDIVLGETTADSQQSQVSLPTTAKLTSSVPRLSDIIAKTIKSLDKLITAWEAGEFEDDDKSHVTSTNESKIIEQNLDEADYLFLAGRNAEAVARLSEVISNSLATVDERSRALVNRAVIAQLGGDVEAAINDYSVVIGSPGTPIEYMQAALVNRAGLRGDAGDAAGALSDSERALSSSVLTPEQRAVALYNRGRAHGQLDDLRSELRDYTAALEVDGASESLKAKALFARAVVTTNLGDEQAAIVDFSKLLESHELAPDFRATVQVNRGILLRRTGEFEHALSEFYAVAEDVNAPIQERAKAFVNIALTRKDQQKVDDAISTLNLAIGLEEIPHEDRIGMKILRATLKLMRLDYKGAEEDYTSIIISHNVSVADKSEALLGRSVVRKKQGEAGLSLNDILQVLSLDDVPPVHLANALLMLAANDADVDNLKSAIGNLTKVIQLQGASKQQRTRAFALRGWYNYKLNQFQQAAEDSQAAAQIDPTQMWIKANLALSKLRLGQGEAAKGIYDEVINNLHTASEVQELVLNDLQAIPEAEANEPYLSEITELVEKRRKNLTSSLKEKLPAK